MAIQRNVIERKVRRTVTEAVSKLGLVDSDGLSQKTQEGSSMDKVYIGGCELAPRLGGAGPSIYISFLLLCCFNPQSQGCNIDHFPFCPDNGSYPLDSNGFFCSSYSFLELYYHKF